MKLPLPSRIVSAIFAVIFGAFVFLVFDNTHPYRWLYGEIIPDPAGNGAQVQVHWRIEKIRWCPGIVTRQVIGPLENGNALVHSYDPFPAFAEKVLPNKINEKFIPFRLPDNLTEGKYAYRVFIDYNCNILQRFWPLHVELPELRFSVK